MFTCLECGVILTNDSMKTVKLEQHQKSKHPSSAGRDWECLDNKRKRQPVKLFIFLRKMNTANTLNASYEVSEIISKVTASQIYGEKLMKPAIIGCTYEVHRKHSASTRCTTPLLSDIITRRQGVMPNFVEEKMVEII